MPIDTITNLAFGHFDDIDSRDIQQGTITNKTIIGCPHHEGYWCPTCKKNKFFNWIFNDEQCNVCFQKFSTKTCESKIY